MLRRFLAAGVLVTSALVAPAAAAVPASAVTISSSTSSAASCYRQVGTHWVCITPGAFCPKAAHNRYGYAKVTQKRYRCTYKSSDPYWRWRRA